MFNTKFHIWINKYFYKPSCVEVLISVLLSPLALIYTILVNAKIKLKTKTHFSIPIISVGNLVVGGTGKTPLTKAIFTEFCKKYTVFIILRGYKRDSKGLLMVAQDGKILCDIKASGDEAMEYALTLKKANVIVCEDRKIAIKKAMDLGANLVILDDGFGKFDIEKFDILLKPEPEPALNITLPSGAYRYPKNFYKIANFIPSPNDIIKHTSITNKTKRMVLVTAIANPERLKFIFSDCILVKFFPDHYSFKKNELEQILKSSRATSLLVTQKDFVKIKDFGLPVSILELQTTISPQFAKILSDFIKNYKQFR